MKRIRMLSLAVLGVCSVAHGGTRIVYEPLSAEARQLGRLEKYRHAEKRQVTVTLGELELTAHLPARCDAYDAVPIEYRLTGRPGPDERVAIEAVAFEDQGRRQGRHLYDLALPGNMKIKIEYLGSQTGVYEPGRVSRLTATSRHETFPPYRLEPFVRSGTVKRGNILFFKFRITNVGDTILDPEGFGGWMAVPDAYQIKPDGTRGQRYGTFNLHRRHTEYVYPGESFEHWVNYNCTGQDATHCQTLTAGRHLIRYVAACRWNKQYGWFVNMWAGKPWFGLEVPIEVSEQAAETPVAVKEVALEGNVEDRMTQYVRSLEEFMTCFKVFESTELTEPAAGTIYLQAAPWTRQVVLKLIGNTPGRIKTAAVPIEVSKANLAIKHNPDNPFVIERNGRREPVFCAQIMPAMRANAHLGPRPDLHLRQRYREAIGAGLNAIASTGGNFAVPQVYNPEVSVGNVGVETFKHFYDVIAPELGVPVFGWAVYPAKTIDTKGLGEHVLGYKTEVPFVDTGTKGYAFGSDLDVAHPDFPKLFAACILFNHRRWGHLWYKTAEGDVLIDVEDTWGWLRDDINLRYYLGKHAIGKFRQWALKRYGSIDRINKAWGTDYEELDEIDPQADQARGHMVDGIDLSVFHPEYTNPDNPFHDWSPAVNDWDVFRTELRCDVYEAVLDHVRREIPNAQINIRTEGALIPVTVPADSDAGHLRHVYYSQRRNALVAEVLKRRKVFKYHSDYTTLPYTESEWRFLLRGLRGQGMRGNYLPQFCTMRDMLLNDYYGRDFQVHYNLNAPKRAIMMRVLQAAYPVWRIMYEEGHVPGVLWEDFTCDGFVCVTQKRELRLFRDQLEEMLKARGFQSN